VRGGRDEQDRPPGPLGFGFAGLPRGEPLDAAGLRLAVVLLRRRSVLPTRPPTLGRRTVLAHRWAGVGHLLLLLGGQDLLQLLLDLLFQGGDLLLLFVGQFEVLSDERRQDLAQLEAGRPALLATPPLGRLGRRGQRTHSDNHRGERQGQEASHGTPRRLNTE
jgi:hypothetical protein